jgi:unsaturated rhamnogalacturonyl hydrolase
MQNLTPQPWSVRMADSVIRRGVPFQWHYEYGLVDKAIERVWQKTGDPRYYDYIFMDIDPLITPEGGILTYQPTEFNLDQIYPGRLLLSLYKTTGEERFRKAMELLRHQLTWQPRTRAGGFWHKLIYPHQMWLDGLYMASIFYAEYSRAFNHPAGLADVVHQIVLLESRTRDPRTGLLYHGWDESRLQRWADPQTGCSPHFWGRAVGWFIMAIVEILEALPPYGGDEALPPYGGDEALTADHPGREPVLAILGRLAEALRRVQDERSGVWYQVLDQGGREGNYLEASASCMAVYAFARAARLGYLPSSYLAAARRGFDGILEQFITANEDGTINLERVCAVAGLGGNPYRDGSYAYYVNERVRANDYKGVGPFILAALELEGADEAH